MVLFVARLTSKVILKNKLLYTEFNSLKMTPPTLIIDTLGKEEKKFYTSFFLTTNFMLCIFSTYEEHVVWGRRNYAIWNLCTCTTLPFYRVEQSNNPIGI